MALAVVGLGLVAVLYLLRVRNTGKSFGVGPKIPTLCNSTTFEDYKKARQVRDAG
jgi:hypothetical protein